VSVDVITSVLCLASRTERPCWNRFEIETISTAAETGTLVATWSSSRHIALGL